MQIKMFIALRRAGVSESDAHAATDAVGDEIKARFQDVKDELASKKDVDKAKTEILSVMERRFGAHLCWTIVTIGGGFGILGIVLNLYRLLP